MLSLLKSRFPIIFSTAALLILAGVFALTSHASTQAQQRLATPANVQVSPTGDTTATVTWNAVAGADTYVVRVTYIDSNVESTAADTSGLTFNPKTITGTSVSISGLPSTGRTPIAVKAVSTSGRSEYSATVDFVPTTRPTRLNIIEPTTVSQYPQVQESTSETTLLASAQTITETHQINLQGYFRIIEGQEASYQISISHAPDTAVTVTAVTDANDGITFQSGNSVTFTPTNWYQPKNLRFSADHDADSTSEEITLTHTVTGDPNYASQPPSPMVHITDDDSVVSITGPTNAIEGTTAQYILERQGYSANELTVNVSYEADAPYTITYAGSKPLTSTLTATFAAGQKFTAVDIEINDNSSRDDDDEQLTLTVDAATTVLPESASSYNPSGTQQTVSTSIKDNDAAGIRITPPHIHATEGEAFSYTVRLETQPKHSVTVTLRVTAVDDQISIGADRVSVVPDPLVFTTSDWEEPQTVTLTVSSETTEDKTHETAKIEHTATSSDTKYEPTPPGTAVSASLTLSISDDEHDDDTRKPFPPSPEMALNGITFTQVPDTRFIMARNSDGKRLPGHEFNIQTRCNPKRPYSDSVTFKYSGSDSLGYTLHFTDGGSTSPTRTPEISSGEYVLAPNQEPNARTNIVPSSCPEDPVADIQVTPGKLFTYHPSLMLIKAYELTNNGYLWSPTPESDIPITDHHLNGHTLKGIAADVTKTPVSEPKLIYAIASEAPTSNPKLFAYDVENQLRDSVYDVDNPAHYGSSTTYAIDDFHIGPDYLTAVSPAGLEIYARRITRRSNGKITLADTTTMPTVHRVDNQPAIKRITGHEELVFLQRNDSPNGFALRVATNAGTPTATPVESPFARLTLPHSATAIRGISQTSISTHDGRLFYSATVDGTIAVHVANDAAASRNTVTPADPPPPPTDLVLTPGATAVMGAWSPPETSPEASPTHYEIQICQATTGNSCSFGTDPSDTIRTSASHYTVWDLNPEQHTSFRVRAHNSDGHSEWLSGTTTTQSRPTITGAPSPAIEQRTTPVGDYTVRDADRDPVTFRIIGTDQQFFEFTKDGDIHSIAFKNAPNFNDPQDADADNTYSIILLAISGSGVTVGAARLEVSIRVTEDDPYFVNGRYEFTIPEDSPPNSIVGTIAAINPRTSDITYSLPPTGDAEPFDIDSQSGEISIAADAALNYEVKASHTFNAVATERQGASSNIPVHITVTDATEPPNAPSIRAHQTSLTATTIVWYTPTNPGPPLTSYRIRHREVRTTEYTEVVFDAPANSHTISELTAQKSYEIALQVSSDEGTSPWSNTVTVTTDTSQPPTFQNAASTVHIIEMAPPGTHVITISATGPDEADLTYTLAGDDAAHFTIDTDTNRVTTAADAEFDYEAKSTYRFDVVATDPLDLSTNHPVTVIIRNVNEPTTGKPAITGDTAVRETLTVDTTAIDDDDGMPVTPSFRYRWTANGNYLNDETNAELVLTEDHRGNNIIVEVRFTDAGGFTETVFSDSVGPITVAKPSTPTVSPTPSITPTASITPTPTNTPTPTPTPTPTLTPTPTPTVPIIQASTPTRRATGFGGGASGGGSRTDESEDPTDEDPTPTPTVTPTPPDDIVSVPVATKAPPLGPGRFHPTTPTPTVTATLVPTATATPLPPDPTPTPWGMEPIIHETVEPTGSPMITPTPEPTPPTPEPTAVFIPQHSPAPPTGSNGTWMVILLLLVSAAAAAAAAYVAYRRSDTFRTMVDNAARPISRFIRRS